MRKQPFLPASWSDMCPGTTILKHRTFACEEFRIKGTYPPTNGYSRSKVGVSYECAEHIYIVSNSNRKIVAACVKSRIGIKWCVWWCNMILALRDFYGGHTRHFGLWCVACAIQSSVWYRFHLHLLQGTNPRVSGHTWGVGGIIIPARFFFESVFDLGPSVSFKVHLSIRSGFLVNVLPWMLWWLLCCIRS